MAILKKELLQEIDESKKKIDTSRVPSFLNEMFAHLREQTIQNSALQDGDNAEKKEEVLKNYREAWGYGDKNCPGKLDLIYLTEIAGRVEPELREPLQKYAGLRKEIRQFRGGYVPPVDEERIRTHLERLFKAEKEMNLHPVERAIFDYFHLIRIQPFFNGNKRTAGIVMNNLLKTKGYLPISIPNKQVPEFESYLMGAIEGFRDVGSNAEEKLTPYIKPDFGQMQFYSFLGRKELSALRGAQNRLAGLQTYNIELKEDSPGAGYALKHQITQYFRAKDLPSHVRVEKRGKTIQVIGEIPMRTLEQMIGRTRGIKNYEINVAETS